MLGRAHRVVLSDAVLRLQLGFAAVPADRSEAVLHGGVDQLGAEGDVASLHIFLITDLLLVRSELGDV